MMPTDHPVLARSNLLNPRASIHERLILNGQLRGVAEFASIERPGRSIVLMRIQLPVN
jgi:hypothetical protein